MTMEGKEMTATLRLTRQPGFAVELRRARFDIVVDDSTVGTIDHGGTAEIGVAPGQHTLRIRRGRYHSPERSFSVADGDSVGFRCHGANLWPIWAASFAVPGLAISLRYE
jgi:hypothetical protein